MANHAERATRSVAAPEERRFMATFEQSAVGMAHLNASGRFIRVNRKFCTLLGYRGEELLSKTFHEITHPDDLESDVTLARQVVAGVISEYSIDKRYLRRDGSPVWVNLTISPVRSGRELIESYAAVIIDISYRKAMELAVQESEERLCLAVRATRDAIWDADLLRGTVWWSDAYDLLFGERPPETRESWQWWIDHLHPEDRARVLETLRAAIGGDTEHWEASYRYCRTDGSYAHVEDRGYVARDVNGCAVRVLGSMRDVTERYRAEERVRRAEHMAVIGNLAAGFSHDMINLIMPVVTQLEILQRSAIAAEAKAPLEIIRACTNGLTALARGMRRLVRAEQRYDGPPFDLRDWWNEAQPLLKAARTGAITLDAEFADDLPPMTVSRDQLTRAVLNLVMNSCEAIEEAGHGSGQVTVWARLDSASPDLLLGVRDDGPGIPAGIRERIFEPFFSTKTRGLGTGLGMSVVRGFATDAGGTVVVESTPGGGTNVIIRLPVRSEHGVP